MVGGGVAAATDATTVDREVADGSEAAVGGEVAVCGAPPDDGVVGQPPSCRNVVFDFFGCVWSCLAVFGEVPWYSQRDVSASLFNPGPEIGFSRGYDEG